MNAYPKVKLKDLVQINYGKALKAEDRDEHGSFDVFGSNGRVGSHSARLVDSPTIVIGRKGSVGAVSFAGSGCWPIDTTFYVQVIDERELDLRYLYYALCRSSLDRRAITTSIPGLNRDDIYSTAIPLAPLTEQRRIAAILDKADAVRRKRRQALDLADTFLRSAFLDMFGDPVTNPKEWPTTTLGEVGTLDRGRSRHRPRNAPELLGGPYPLIQTGDVANADHYIRDYSQTYSEIGLAQSKMWPAGTLCITIAANIAKTAILDMDACFPDSVVGFAPGKDVRTEYVQYWLGFLQKAIEDRAPESAQKNINLAILRKLEMPLPPVGTQDEFVRLLARSEKMKGQLRSADDASSHLFESLAQRAFRGEL